MFPTLSTLHTQSECCCTYSIVHSSGHNVLSLILLQTTSIQLVVFMYLRIQDHYSYHIVCNCSSCFDQFHCSVCIYLFLRDILVELFLKSVVVACLCYDYLWLILCNGSTIPWIIQGIGIIKATNRHRFGEGGVPSPFNPWQNSKVFAFRPCIDS